MATYHKVGDDEDSLTVMSEDRRTELSSPNDVRYQRDASLIREGWSKDYLLRVNLELETRSTENPTLLCRIQKDISSRLTTVHHIASLEPARKKQCNKSTMPVSCSHTEIIGMYCLNTVLGMKIQLCQLVTEI